MAIILEMEPQPDRLTQFIYALLWEFCTVGQLDVIIGDMDCGKETKDKRLLELAEHLASRISNDDLA